ncbi:unnamed protein product [Urochloa humidicola]
MLRRIQPLKARSLTAYKYAGEDNFNHEAPERLNKADACNRLSKFFARGTSLRTTGGPLPFSLGNPRPEGRLAFFSRPPLPEQPRQVGLAPVDPIAALHQARTAGLLKKMWAVAVSTTGHRRVKILLLLLQRPGALSRRVCRGNNARMSGRAPAGSRAHC